MNQEELVEDLALLLGVSIQEADDMYNKFKLAVESFNSGKTNYELLVDSISMVTQNDDPVCEQPLWVKKQQNKTFKRGKQ